MGLKTFFFDSYAMHEIVVGNKNFDKYLFEVSIMTTIFQLMELHYSLLRDYGKETADEEYDYFKKFVIEINDETIKKANEFRYKNKVKKFSYIDCVGYTIARIRGIKFLTGDNAFKGVEGVEFVK
jgi:hypothetical protein